MRRDIVQLRVRHHHVSCASKFDRSLEWNEQILENFAIAVAHPRGGVESTLRRTMGSEMLHHRDYCI